jgi:hypothetical protein
MDTQRNGAGRTHLVEVLRPKIGGSGFDSMQLLGKFQDTYSFYPNSVALGPTQSLTEMNTKEFH